jgi:hypothetical protein
MVGVCDVSYPQNSLPGKLFNLKGRPNILGSDPQPIRSRIYKELHVNKPYYDVANKYHDVYYLHP